MKIRGTIATLIFGLMICLSFDAVSDTSSSDTKSNNADAILIANEIPFAKNNHIAANIKRECHLPGKLAEFIKSYAQDYGISITQKPSVSPTDTGRVLVVEITDSVSRGNAFFGHRKYTEIAGTLYQDGNPVGSFKAARNSGGGAFATFKSSCAVLGRTVKALGRDVGHWLKSPVMEASLGDIR
jgi:hypothetical protein